MTLLNASFVSKRPLVKVLAASFAKISLLPDENRNRAEHEGRVIDYDGNELWM